MPLSARHRRRLNEVRDGLIEAREARDDAIAAAWLAGAGLREIEREVGISHVAISKLLDRNGIRRRVPKDEHEQDRGRWYG